MRSVVLRFFSGLFALGAFCATCLSPARADDPSPATTPTTAADASQENVVQEFSGSGTTTTGFFTVRDHWEVRWNARAVVSVAVMSKDGSIVAGAAGVLRGSLFVPLGGDYYLKVSDGTVAPPPTSSMPPAVTNAAPVALTNAASAATTNAAPATNAPPSSVIPSTENGATADSDAAAPLSWHLQVVELSSSVTADKGLTVYTPYFIEPDTAITPAPPPPPPPVLTSDEAQAVVKIKGDRAEGAGFLLHTVDGDFVVTHLHLVAANPHLVFTTWGGQVITTTGLKGSLDRDIAMFSIQDDHFSYLSLPQNKDNVDSGDALIIPDLAGQADPLLGQAGRVIGATAERLDFDNPVGPACAGAPVILAQNGEALALVTAVKRLDLSSRLAQAWAANPAPGSSTIIPAYGLRLTGTSGWENYDPKQFLAETLFLRQFHHATRCLDSFLNGARRRRYAQGSVEVGPPDSRYFQKDPQIQSAYATYNQFASGADFNQRIEAAHELLFDLQGIANADVDTIQSSSIQYAYDKTWAEEEMAYRRAIQKELSDFSNNLPRLDDVARTR